MSEAPSDAPKDLIDAVRRGAWKAGELHAAIEQKLAPIERTVVRLRLGLAPDVPSGQAYEIPEIARILRKSRDRVRRIEQRSVEKLSAFAENPDLRDSVRTEPPA